MDNLDLPLNLFLNLMCHFLILIILWYFIDSFLACQIVAIFGAKSMNDERRLIWSLMRNYEK